MSINRDQNRIPYTDNTYSVVIATPTAFAGGTENARGDQDGTGNPLTLFTVTGEVEVRIFGVCTVNLTGDTATVEVGTATSTAGLIAQTTGTDIDAGELWHDASPDTNIEAATVAPAKFIVNGADIIETVGTANVTAGNIKYICLWKPITKGSTVEAA